MLILALTYTHAHAPYYRASLLRRFFSSNLEKRKLWVKTFRVEKVKNWTHGKGPHQTSRARARLKRGKKNGASTAERERDYRSRRLEETRHKAPPCLPDAKPMLLFPCPPSRTSTTIRITLLCAWRIPTPAFNANPTRIGR